MNRQVPCTNCGLDSPALWDEGDAHDSGLVISASCVGYYNGFMDSLDGDVVAYICHDCSLLLMRTMSGLAKFLMPLGAGHPVSGNDSPPCCEFAWTFGDENGETVLLVGTTDGTWELSQTS